MVLLLLIRQKSSEYLKFTIYMKLSESLYLKGDSSIEIILDNTDGKAHERYEAVKKVLQAEVEPALQTYFNGLNIPAELAKVDTIEVLEKVEIDYMPMNIKTLIVDTIDTLEFTEGQKLWLFAIFLQSFYQGAAARISTLFKDRAQQIMSKKRIIQP